MDREPWVEDPTCIEKPFSVATERAQYLSSGNCCQVRVVPAFRDKDTFTVEIPASLYKAFLARLHWKAAIEEGDMGGDEIDRLEKECREAEREFHRIQHDGELSEYGVTGCIWYV